MNLLTLLKSENGNILVIFALCLGVIIGSVALTIDGGRIFHEKSILQNATDASALGGAQGLFVSQAEATSIAMDLATKNNFPISGSNLSIAGNTVKVTRDSTIPTIFAKILGINEVTVSATATAAIAPLTTGEGISPIAVEKDSIPTNSTLNCENTGTYSGNCGFLQVDDYSTLRDAIMYGSDYSTGVEDLDTNPGGKAGQVEQAVDYLIEKDAFRSECQSADTAEESCARTITVVVVETLDLNGSKQVNVLGFAEYFLKGMGWVTTKEDGTEEVILYDPANPNDPNYPQGKPDRIIGEFIKRMDVGAVGGSEENYEGYLLSGVKLIN